MNETRFGPKKKSSPIYLGPKNLDTFWCTGWAWNCQIIFRCASIHGRAGFILVIEICCALNDIWFIMEWSKWVEFNNLIIQVYLFLAGNIYYVPLTHKCILGNLHVLPFSYSPVNTRVGSPIKHYLFIPSIGLSICYMVLCLLLIHRPLFNEIYSNKVPVKWNLQHYKPSLTISVSLFTTHLVRIYDSFFSFINIPMELEKK